MIGDKPDETKQTCLVRAQGEWWLTKEQLEAIAKYAVWHTPELVKMTMRGAVAEYFRQAVLDAIEKATGVKP